MMTDRLPSEQSLFQKLDPRTLLAAAIAAAFCFSFVRNIAPSCLALVFGVILAAVSGIRVMHLLKRLAAGNVFVGFIWLTVPLTMPGEDGTRLALLMTLKCNAIFLSFLALAGGIGPSGVGCALERLRMPAKLVFLFFFTSRYIHVVGEEWRRLRTAAALRGFVPRTSIHTYRTVGNMLGLTVINAVERSRRIYEAMLLRGFDGVFRTVAESRAGQADALFAGMFFLALAGVLLFDMTAARP